MHIVHEKNVFKTMRPDMERPSGREKCQTNLQWNITLKNALCVHTRYQSSDDSQTTIGSSEGEKD